MIRDHDRSYYIGASDTEYVIRSWNTKTFEKWYLTKMGWYHMDFKNDAMRAGTAYEHKILDSLNIPGMQKDKQVVIGRLRVNLDGDTGDTIYEVKTHRCSKPFKIPKGYRDQVNVQMYATGIRRAFIAAYGLEEEDYINFYNDIDTERITLHEILYDPVFIDKIYLPRFWYLCDCLNKGTFPKESDYLCMNRQG